MNCDSVRALLLLHAGDDLPPDQAAEVEAHLTGCARCRAELAVIREDLAAVHRLAEGTGHQSLPPGFVQDVFAAAARDQPPPARELMPRLPLAAAAVLVIVLIGALQFGGQLTGARRPAAGLPPLGPFGRAALAPELAVAGGWTLSSHPLCSDEVGVPPGELSPDLIGVWGDPADSTAETWQFLDGGGGAYRLVIGDQGSDLPADPARDGIFEARLLRLAGSLLLDLYPAEPEGVDEYLPAHIMPAHSFLRVDLQDHLLTLSPLDRQWLKESLESGRLDLPYQLVEGTLVLTAATPRLQAALAPHLAEACGDPQTLRRLR